MIVDASVQFIQDDFVKERQAGTSSNDAGKTDVVTSDDLIIRMMVAKYVFPSHSSRGTGELTAVLLCRLLAASYHQPEVTNGIWEEAKALDARRKARLV